MKEIIEVMKNNPANANVSLQNQQLTLSYDDILVTCNAQITEEKLNDKPVFEVSKIEVTEIERHGSLVAFSQLEMVKQVEKWIDDVGGEQSIYTDLSSDAECQHEINTHNFHCA